jgi:uncharacterized protein (TIGR02145 family)
MKSTFKKISFILSVVLMSLAVSYALGAWQEPSSSPPDGNVSAPINISSTAQTKKGGLTLQGDFTAPTFYDSDNTDYYVNPAGQTVLAGNVGIGTTNPGSKLEVNGNIIADTPTADDHVATKGYVDNFTCGDNVNFIYNGKRVTYGTVESQGECWMDRNLGAFQVATSYDDEQAYGDLFQWGRLDDGHQTRTSDITSTLSNADDPGHSNFIISGSDPYDWRSPQNDNLWQGEGGINNPCPPGWRVPTESEWTTEMNSWGSSNYNGAYASPLKLTAGGTRGGSNSSLYDVGSSGFYSSSAVGGIFARGLHFYSSDAYIYSYFRAYGPSVRCVQD